MNWKELEPANIGVEAAWAQGDGGPPLMRLPCSAWQHRQRARSSTQLATNTKRAPAPGSIVHRYVDMCLDPAFHTASYTPSVPGITSGRRREHRPPVAARLYSQSHDKAAGAAWRVDVKVDTNAAG